MVIVGRSKGVSTSKAEPGHATSDSQAKRPRNAALANLMLPIWTIKEIFVVRSPILVCVKIFGDARFVAAERGLSFTVSGDRPSNLSRCAVICDNAVM